MTDDKILANLYELRARISEPLKLEQLIDKWIAEVQTDVALHSDTTIGLGASGKTFQGWIKLNRKIYPQLCGVMPMDKRGAFMFASKAFVVKSKGNLGLPIVPPIDKLPRLKQMLKDGRSYEQKILLPSRAELELYIKGHKDTPKYSLGDGLPTVNAKYLSDMLTIFTNKVCYIGDEGKYSPLYFKFGTFEGLLMPLS